MVKKKRLEAKLLLVYAKPLNVYPDDKDTSYSFPVYEFSNGLILVTSNTTNDWFFEDRDSIEPCGTDVVDYIEETGKLVDFTAEEILLSVQGSIKEFGIDSVPKKHLELWK